MYLLSRLSNKRALRSQELRGFNILKFQRSFKIGDVVKFEVGGAVKFGEVIGVDGSKLYKVKRLISSEEHYIHAYQLEGIAISKEFLLEMLKP